MQIPTRNKCLVFTINNLTDYRLHYSYVRIRISVPINPTAVNPTSINGIAIPQSNEADSSPSILSSTQN